MAKAKLKYIKYTKSELDKYVADKGSCVNLLNHDLHISFPPWGFSNFQETVTNIISRDKIGKYDAKFNGIVLDVRNIKVFGTNYAVHDDDPYNHINLNANFYLFQPIVGATITGVVKHISHRHVAAIIYRVFNVSIRFKKQPNQTMQINQQISFKIKSFDLQDGMPYIEGELIADALSNVKRKIVFDDNDDVENGVDSGISTEETGAMRKKTLPAENGNDESSSESSSSDDDDEFGLNDIKKQLFGNIKIKKEKITDDEDSSSESEDNKEKLHKTLLKNQLTADSNSSDDDSRSDSSLSVKIKREKRSSSSSGSSSGSGSDSDSDASGPVVIKKEKITKSQEITASSQTSKKSVTIKKEPVSESSSSSEEDARPKSSSPKKTPKRSQNLSITDHLENIFLDTISNSQESTSSLSNQAKKPKAATKRKSVQLMEKPSTSKALFEQSLPNISEFATPVLSSTLKPKSSQKKRKKEASLLDSLLDDCLDNTLKELETNGGTVASTPVKKPKKEATPKGKSLIKNGSTAEKKTKKATASKKDVFGFGGHGR